MANEQSAGTNTPRVITLCGSQGCCPTVTINEETQTVILKDDFGGAVTLKFEEWKDALKNAQI